MAFRNGSTTGTANRGCAKGSAQGGCSRLIKKLLYSKPRGDFIAENEAYKDDLYCVPVYGDKTFTKCKMGYYRSWFTSRSTFHMRGWIDGIKDQGQILPTEIFNEFVKYGKTTCFYDLTSISDIKKCVFPQRAIIRIMNPFMSIGAQVRNIKAMIKEGVSLEKIQKRKNMLGVEYDIACKGAQAFDNLALENAKNFKDKLADAAEAHNAEQAPGFNKKQKIKMGIFSGFFGLFTWAANPVLHAFNYCGMVFIFNRFLDKGAVCRSDHRSCLHACL